MLATADVSRAVPVLAPSTAEESWNNACSANCHGGWRAIRRFVLATACIRRFRSHNFRRASRLGETLRRRPHTQSPRQLSFSAQWSSIQEVDSTNRTHLPQWPSRPPVPGPSYRHLSSRRAEWAAPGACTAGRMPYRPFPGGLGRRQRGISLVYLRKYGPARRFPYLGLGRAQLIFSRHSRFRPRGPGDDAWLFRSFLRGRHPGEIRARLARLHLVFPTLRPSFRGNMRQPEPAHEPRIASASRAIHARGTHFRRRSAFL